MSSQILSVGHIGTDFGEYTHNPTACKETDQEKRQVGNKQVLWHHFSFPVSQEGNC